MLIWESKFSQGLCYFFTFAEFGSFETEFKNSEILQRKEYVIYY